MTGATSRPLERFTVLDMTHVRSGPAAVRQLADWGARVIKIEMPISTNDDRPGGPAQVADYQNTHRSKRSLTLNLKEPRGLDAFMELVRQADVVVENYRPDVKFRLGIDYERLATVNPGIVYASISGFGQDGPYAMRPGLDQIAQGISGLMQVTGEKGRGPMRAGIPIADLSAGLFCANGILTALLERETSGRGQWVQTSLLQAQIYMMDFQAMRWLMNAEVPNQSGNDHPTSSPTGVFETRDSYMNIAAMGNTLFAKLCETIGAPELIGDPRFQSVPDRAANRPALNAAINTCTRTRDTLDWIACLNDAGVPCGPILTLDQTFADPQVQHLEAVWDLEHPQLGMISVLGQPFKLSRTPPASPTPAPARGQHSREILSEFGFSSTEIAALASAAII
ncbi:CaiB/BaiF CoA transferase family protein [Bosea sp. 2KB_26]|uniref:CaiB/BaiF CoA transferase family protein n=1 Tax=Bosea sp. 2KB_26 TaxID=3237475 RepID=UPI003F908F2C